MRNFKLFLFLWILSILVLNSCSLYPQKTETAKVETIKPEIVKTEISEIAKIIPEIQTETVATNTGDILANTGAMEQSTTETMPEITNSGSQENLVLIPLGINNPSTQSWIVGNTSLTKNWKIYKNEKFWFQVRYPENWIYSEYDDNGIFFWTTESISGGYIWWLYINEPSELDKLMTKDGQQFDDRKELRKNILVNDSIPATLVTVTTGKYENWISKSVYFEKNNKIFTLSNGAIDDARFEYFYNSIEFNR